jgi:hypothetical protein
MWGSGKFYVKPLSILQFPKPRISKGAKAMNRDKVVEALAKRMAFAARERHDVSEDATEFWVHTSDAGKDKWRKVAAAVLDLCGPEKLVWEDPCAANNYCTIARTPRGDYYVDVCGGRHQAWMESLTKPYEVQIGEPVGYMPTAQAAAQAHATAAHWANTPLGKLVGVV